MQSRTPLPQWNTKTLILSVNWCGHPLSSKGGAKIFLASYYRPPNAKHLALDQLAASLTKLYTKARQHAPTVILAGDFNLPDIDWDSLTPTKPGSRAKHQKLLDMLEDFPLTNLQKQQTRPRSQNVLDLVLASTTTMVRNIQVKPRLHQRHYREYLLTDTPVCG